MSMQITSNSITTTSGKLLLEEDGKQIELRNGQVIITNKFVSVGTYVFKRGTVIPLAYFANKSSSSGTISYAPATSSPQFPTEYTSALATILTDPSISRSYSVSACKSQLTSGSAKETTEFSFYSENKSFSASVYDKNNPAPMLICDHVQVPYSSSTLSATVTGSGESEVVTLTTNAPNSYMYITLMVTL